MTSPLGLTSLSIFGEAPIEAQGQFPAQVQGGVGQDAYCAIVGVAARTLIRGMDIIPTVAGNVGFLLLRAPVTGLTLIASVWTATNGNPPLVQAQCASGPNTGAIVGLAQVLFQQPSGLSAGVGSFNLVNPAGPQAPLPIFLFPGDVIVGQIHNAGGTAALEVYATIAEFAS